MSSGYLTFFFQLPNYIIPVRKKINTVLPSNKRNLLLNKEKNSSVNNIKPSLIFCIFSMRDVFTPDANLPLIHCLRRRARVEH